MGMMGLDRRGAGGVPWKSAKNYLTTLLTEIGVGKAVEFEVVRGREKLKVALSLETAPPDYENAERYKEEELGFTVKELTYEVRHVQKLDPAEGGVVVAKVESGTKSDVAKLAPMSIISRVNAVPVRSLAHFRELLAASRGLTLTTVLYGQTKLVELSRD
jgi:hypothetical protein